MQKFFVLLQRQLQLLQGFTLLRRCLLGQHLAVCLHGLQPSFPALMRLRQLCGLLVLDDHVLFQRLHQCHAFLDFGQLPGLLERPIQKLWFSA